jgi:nucleotide-binding universal stress UspA family protein
MTHPCRILVAADFSMGSDAALDYAADLASRVGGTIDLLHVRAFDATTPEHGLGSTFFADSCEGVAMEEALSRRRHGRVEVRGRLESGDVCETIARVAATDGFDFVVMGDTSAPPGSQRIARAVARSVHCPIITVRARMEPE